MAKIAASLIRGYRRRVRDSAPALSSAVLRQLGGEVAESVADSIDSSDWTRLFGHSIDPRSYCSASDFARDYLAVSLLSKYPVRAFATDKRREEVALEKFEASERACLATNERLKRPVTEGSISISAQSVIYTAAKKIADLLGPFNWNEAEKHFGFGPGATFRVPSRKGDPYYKFRFLPEATPSCVDLGLLAISRSPRWYGVLASMVLGPVGPQSIEAVPGNRITTVPKNAKTDRIIAIEPTLNMFLQKGIGGLIRSKLRKAGVDLNDQRPNQVAARIGSTDGSLATLDLASASDSVSLELCRQLLPPDWFQAMEMTRSPYGVLPSGKVIKYQKISSMGNGFTFELESLLFWAVARAVGELFHPRGDRRLFVYGDDLVVPTALAEDLSQWLAYFGFDLNPEKSFVDGPFRESCGKHYFLGVDVTPFYVRKPVDAPPRSFWFHNQLVRWLRRYHPGSIVAISKEWHDLLKMVRSTVPEAFLGYLVPYGEEGTADDFSQFGFFACFDEANPTRVCRFGAYTFTGIGLGIRSERFVDDAYLVRNLYFLKEKKEETEPSLGSRYVVPAYSQSSSDDAIRKFKEAMKVSGVATREVVRTVRLTSFKWDDPYLVL
jgi:hypothetical protein